MRLRIAINRVWIFEVSEDGKYYIQAPGVYTTFKKAKRSYEKNYELSFPYMRIGAETIF